ncbi:MAG: hypothetical protein B1H03_06330 [Planctomycetales bacterium 4484_113]|nr:MAG: hypothetical protein B1H03_06330 [Planctomycetales bacterium 4484_113]
MSSRLGSVLGLIGLIALIVAVVIVNVRRQAPPPPPTETVTPASVQAEVGGEQEEGVTPARPPLPTPSGPESEAPGYPEYSAAEAWSHVGEFARVVYTVSNPYRSTKGNIFLHEKRDYRSGFSVVIFSNVRERWSDHPMSLYGHRRIRVTGLIKTYEGHPEIIVDEPSQIEVIE